MAGSLKDALIIAGVVSKDALERDKENARREKIQQKGPSQEGIHAHHIRTDCAHCKKNASDVEYYEHSNRSVEAKWLCMICADKLWIKDECRQSNQSSHAKAGKFRREFGATKKFPPPSQNQAQTQIQTRTQNQSQSRNQGPNSNQVPTRKSADVPQASKPAEPAAPGRIEYPARQFPKRRK